MSYHKLHDYIRLFFVIYSMLYTVSFDFVIYLCRTALG